MLSTVQSIFPLLFKDIKWGSRVGGFLWKFLFIKVTNTEISADAGPFPKKLTGFNQCNRNNSSTISHSKHLPFWLKRPSAWAEMCLISVMGRFPREALDPSLWHSQSLQHCCYLGQIIRQHECTGGLRGERHGQIPIHIAAANTASKPSQAKFNSNSVNVSWVLTMCQARELLDAANFQAFGLNSKNWKRCSHISLSPPLPPLCLSALVLRY